MAEGEGEVEEEEGEGEGEEEAGGEMAPGFFPGGGDGKEHGAEEEGGIDAEVEAEIGEEFAGAEGVRLGEAAAFAEVSEGDPIVLGVPEEDGDGEEGEGEEERGEARTKEESAEAGGEGEEEGDGEELEGVGVFGEKTGADQGTGERPVEGESGAFFEGVIGGGEGGGPEEDGEGIDGHDQRARVEDGGAVDEEDRPDGGGRIVEAFGEVGDDQAGAEGEEGAEGADAEFGDAEKVGAQPDGEGDPGAFTEVAGGEVLAPLEVVGFIWGEVDLGTVEESEEGEGAEKEGEEESMVHAEKRRGWSR